MGWLRVIMSDATRILTTGLNSATADELLPLVYEELRKLAAHKMANEVAGQTLQPTVLVHEAYLRLIGSENVQWNSRNHFFMAAAEAMRRILIENARRKSRQKRGGEWERVHLENLDVATEANSDTLLIIILHEALERLAIKDQIKAQLVQLRFFVGLTNEEAGQVLNLSEPTVKRYWAYSRAWLMQEIERIQQEI